MLQYLPMILRSLWTSVYITIVVGLLGGLVGILVYLGKISNNRLSRWLAGFLY